MCQSREPPSGFFLDPGAPGREDEPLSPGTFYPADFGAYDASSSLSGKDEAVALELVFGHGSGMAANLTSRDSSLAQEPKESSMTCTALLKQTSWPSSGPHGLSVEGPFQMAAQTGHKPLPPKYAQELFLPRPTGPPWRSSTSLVNTANDITIHWKGCYNRGLAGKRSAEGIEKEDVTEGTKKPKI